MKVTYITPKQHLEDLNMQLEKERRYLEVLDPKTSERIIGQCKQKIKDLEQEIYSYGHERVKC